jgi:hypothetical protein
MYAMKRQLCSVSQSDREARCALYLGAQTTWYLLEYTTLLFDLYLLVPYQDYAKRSYRCKHFRLEANTPYIPSARAGALRRFLGNDCRLRRIELLYALAPAGQGICGVEGRPCYGKQIGKILHMWLT